jgi:hypothetical protein
VQAALEDRAEAVVDEPVTLDAALAFEGRRHDINAEVSFAAFPPPGVAVMQVRFVRHLEVRRLKPLP